jgi:serine/threonine protein kinase/WD40 repeat protein
MNRDAKQHPPQDQLEAYGRGKLDEAESSQIEKHLEECEDCTGTVVNLKDDTFIKLVRETPRADATVPPEPAAKPACAEPTTPDATIAIDAAAPTSTSTGRLDELPRELREHPRYEVLELIGRGGMGDVYKAQHRVMNRIVALKVIKPEMVQNEEAVKRFRREVQAAARLHHKNIVTAHDAEQAGDLHFLVMEYADGVDLDEFVRRRGAMAVDQACECISQAAEGLQYAHELGMVHRDIKPHNLMLTRSGEVKILDFGLASFASETAAEDKIYPSEAEETSPSPRSPQLTRSGSMMGTPDFISPEQALDAHTADIRADIYSLGCTFYKLLTGKPPFDEGSVMDKIHAHSKQRAAPLSEFRDDVPDEVQAVLLKMMAKLANGRYQQPREVVEALSRHRDAAALPLPPAPARPAPSRRKPIMLAAVATMLISAILAGIIFYVQTNVGTVRVEVADESLEVTLAGHQITMRDGETPVTIRPGEQSLVVRRGEFEFDTDTFEIRRGDKLAIKVELLAGKIMVTSDGQLIGSKPLPGGIAEGVASGGKAGPWTPLFNGKDLTGWKTTTDYPNKWIVKDGLLTTTGATYARLFSEPGDYENFHLRAEVRLSETGNSGVYFRSEFGYGFDLKRIGGSPTAKVPLGLEADLVAVPGPTSGGVGPAGTVFRLGETESDRFLATSHEVEPDTWFTFELIADARQVTVKINGKLVNRFEADGSYTAGGHIALAATRGHVEFRKIEISETASTALPGPVEHFKPMFNGRDLSGWKPHPQLPGNWRVENGVIVGSGDFKNAFLVTQREDYDHFLLRAEVRVNSAEADSGVFIDYPGKWGSHIETNIEIAPDSPKQHTGSIQLSKQSWQAAPAGLASPGEWFVLEVVASEGQVVSKVNGRVAAVLQNRSTQAHGSIMLQQFGSQTRVEFRKIEIRELTADGSPAVVNRLPELKVLSELGANARHASPAPDGLTIYWEADGNIWQASRTSPKLPFANKRPLLKGMQPAITGDGLELVFIRPSAGKSQLYLANRASTDAPFDNPRVILPEEEMVVYPWIAADGRALVFQRVGQPEVQFASRPNRISSWSKGETLTLFENEEASRISAPSLPTDGMLLFCADAGVNRPEGNLMVWQRANRTEPFAAHQYLDITGLPALIGDFPRYAVESKDLYFTQITDQNKAEVVEIRNFTIPKISKPPELLREARTFEGHQRAVKSVAFSPNGKYIASASGWPSSDNTARIWDRQTGEQLHLLSDHQTRVVTVTFSPEGSLLLSGDDQGRIIFWDPETGRKVSECRCTGYVEEAVFTPDGKQIVVATGTNKLVEVIEVETGKLMNRYPYYQKVNGVTLHPDGSRVVVSLYDGTVRLYNLEDGGLIRKYEAAKIPSTTHGEAYVAAISPDGTKIAAGYKANTVRVWDLASGRVLRDIRTANSGNEGLAFLADSRHLAVSGPNNGGSLRDPIACVVDTETGDVVAQTPTVLGHGWAFALSPDDRYMLTGGGMYYDSGWKASGNYEIRMWQLPESAWPKPKNLEERKQEVLDSQPDAAREAALVWLKHADAGEYEKCAELSTSPEFQVSSKQIVELLTTVRKDLGSLVERSERAVNVKQVSGRKVVELLYRAEFEKAGRMTETLLLVQDSAGTWHVGGYTMRQAVPPAATEQEPSASAP